MNDTPARADQDDDEPLARASVLLVDDTPENLVAMEVVLEELDCDPVSVTSGNAALGQLLKREFALVLLDVQMPGMDGFEVAELMRNYPRTKNVPIIFVTAISKEDRYVRRGYQAGAVDYLFKPLDPTILRAKVRFFLELDQQKRRLESKLARSRASREALFAAYGDMLEHPLPPTEH
ncbi:sensory box protein/response regulator [Isoalcanivorax pacificus W11-5]|uniref:Sensory box protein/response regulator n=1 Tax=Isoalcanivorax pacificus W11-5 TaxID=391936 RepID=A0A0B4XMX8_9GAMM|nr:response regulator [Isoalcanivorax pacificus]AJD48030.1 sensory box protein/response regulator [Isoalcanivorax pacificus W11-5]